MSIFIWYKLEWLSRLMRFGVVSAAGLGLDVGLFLLLVHLGMRAGYANLISAAVAVTFVYIASTKRVFEYAGGFLAQLFVLYASYQILAVAAASWTVDFIVALGVEPVVSKGLILPVTFFANYLFLNFLTRDCA